MRPLSPEEKRWYVVLLGTVVTLLWILPARSSFWLDETATYWMIKDGFHNALLRPAYWSGQSPFYYLTAWLALQIGGAHEFVLRVPSIIAASLAAIWLFRLAAILFDDTTAWLAALVFVCSGSVAFAAADARPYALGLAMLVGAVLAFERWADSGRLLYAAGYVLLSALALYAHPFFIAALAPLAIYALWRMKLSALLPAWLATAFLLAPLVAQLLLYFRNSHARSFAFRPEFADLATSLAPPALTAAVAFGFLAAWASMTRDPDECSTPRPAFLLAAAWAITPPLACFAVSVLTPTRIFVPRYYIGAAPGLALVAAWVIRSNSGQAWRRIIAACVALAALLYYGSMHHGNEDWQDAMEKVREQAHGSDMPVLMPSGFVEASDPQTLDDPRLRDVLFAPLLLYQAAGHVVRLPYSLDEKSLPYLETALPELEHHDRFLFVSQYDGNTYVPWLEGRISPEGYRVRSLGAFGATRVFAFERSAAR